MQLIFRGHDQRYAVEQTLLSLFPQERPVYDAAPGREANSLTLSLQEEAEAFTATAELFYGERRAEQTVRLEKDGRDQVSLTRIQRRCLQQAFYLTATELLGREPPWGMLSGVRPVKLPVRAVLGGKTLEEAEEQLRQTYHVSPQRLGLAMDCARFSLDTLGSLRPEEISLYVGIPFCPSRCAYCSFISAAEHLGSLIPAYLDALLQEIAAAGKAVARQGLRVKSVYIGGGTPTTLSAPQMTTLLTALRQHFPLAPDLEFTVEAGRPDTITPDILAALRAGGVNRVSVNPQSMSDQVLRAVGRNHSAADVLRVFPLVRQAGFESINMDLIAGLPGDTIAGFSQSLDAVLALEPENITVHSLAMKRGAQLRQAGESAVIPTGEAVAAMLEHAWSSLREGGYLPYYLYRQKFMSGSFENIGWCKPGHESIYNICMMEELHSILSLGAGGVSKTVHYEKGSLTRHANPKYPQEYIRALPRILQEKEQLLL